MVTFENPNLYAGRVYCFHTEPTKRDLMGYALSGFSKGDVIPQGTPIVANDNDTNGKKTAVVCKYAKIKSKVDAKNFIVEDLGFLAVGDKIYKSGADKATVTLSTISAIDKATKKITFSANNNDLAAGDIVLEGKSVTTGEGSSAVTTTEPVAIPNRIVARHETLTEKNKTVSATHQAIAIKNVLNYPAEWLNTTTFPGYTCLAGCPLIMFVNQ